LNAAGVRTTVQRFDGMIHGFFGMTHLVKGARDAMAFACRELRSAFEEARQPPAAPI